MDEQSRFPYEAKPFEARKVLLLATHPDDEILGAGGTLALLAASGAEVRIVVFSRGEAWGDAAVRMEPAERVSVTVHATTFQQVEEFRIGDGRAVGIGGLSVALQNHNAHVLT